MNFDTLELVERPNKAASIGYVRSDKMCVACEGQEARILFQCGHFSYCYACFKEVQDLRVRDMRSEER